jgi:hypothetical protein
MNWSRGLLRGWIVCSVIWVSLCVVGAIGHWPRTPVDDWINPEASGPYKGLSRALTDAEVDASHSEYVRHRRAVWTHVGTMTLFALTPPVALFASGYVLLWVGRGFRKA